ncbi:MAG: polysaccharide deacetylase family protein [Faecousia sp.]
MRRILALLLAAALLVLPVRAAEGTKYVALTFDDGPSGKYTRQLLDGLYDRGVKATFLLCGYRIKDYPDITQRIFDEGHEIGYHGYSHQNMSQMSRRDIAAEIMDTQALLPEGCDPVFLRPPGGCCSDGVRQVARARQLAILNWSVDPRDWATHDTAAIEQAVLKNVKDGDIVLLHDMTTSSVQAALDIVDVLLAQNYEIVTVSQLAKVRRTTLKPGQEYCCFPRKEENNLNK